MTRKITALVCILLIMISICGCNKKENDSEAVNNVISGEDKNLPNRLENMIELQKNVFIGKITAVSTENAIIPKFNLDISDYTVYTVEVSESLDSYTPTGPVRVFSVGTTEEFITRISMQKNETYIIDATPWVYGNDVVYLLSFATVAYPKVDIAGMVTIENEDGELFSCGSLEEYKKAYFDAKTEVVNRCGEDYFTPAKVADRLLETATEIKQKNADRSFYTDMKFEWVPSDEFIEKNAENSEYFYNTVKALADKENVTDAEIKELFTVKFD